jgi:hypothetical protein
MIMSKELFIEAHEQLIEEYLEKHPEATEAEAYEKTTDHIQDRYADNFGSRIDYLRMLQKEGKL